MISSLRLESIGVCFQREVKKNPNCKQKHSFFTAEKRTVTWLFKYFTFDGLSKLNQNLSLPSFFVLYIFTFISLSIWISQSDKHKSRFDLERPYNSEIESEYTVPKCENHVQVSLICLTRLILSKISFYFQYISQLTSIFILQFGYRLKYRD